MKKELQRNYRLRFAFQVCKDLGVDDPVAWFNAVPSVVMDWWLAYYSLVADENNRRGRKQTPEEAYQQLMSGK